jgi:hypothetical protein
MKFYHSTRHHIPEDNILPIDYLAVYKTIILPVVVYGCETWSLTLMEEQRLRVFENRVLRRIFGPKRGELVQLVLLTKHN